MSQLTALPRPATRAARPSRSARPTPKTPRLRLVETKDAAEHTGAGFVVLCVLLLVGGLISLLLLNTNRAQESFAIEKLQARSASLTDQQQQLAGEIDTISAPQQLALQAQGLGLEPAAKVRYVRKSDGKQLGVATRSGKDSALTVDTLPSTPASRVAGVAVSAASSSLLVTKLAPAEKATAVTRTERGGAKKSEKQGTTTKSTTTDNTAKPTAGSSAKSTKSAN
ncbi:hypothetical protein [Flexivirga oryzae]|uniref:Cell division protein FtsL n=1 Tax=Flexivirga oryzae TaxID=1794944 RepID=A0A839N3E7_9MICO|nr:hypothetical protein [Flexivirga oryzae]MBB2890594.1 hypothetical protein [Flexivirga oryzae]